MTERPSSAKRKKRTVKGRDAAQKGCWWGIAVRGKCRAIKCAARIVTLGDVVNGDGPIMIERLRSDLPSFILAVCRKAIASCHKSLRPPILWRTYLVSKGHLFRLCGGNSQGLLSLSYGFVSLCLAMTKASPAGYKHGI